MSSLVITLDGVALVKCAMFFTIVSVYEGKRDTVDPRGILAFCFYLQLWEGFMNMSEEKQKRYLDQLTNNEKKSDSTGNQFPLFGQYQQAS